MSRCLETPDRTRRRSLILFPYLFDHFHSKLSPNASDGWVQAEKLLRFDSILSWWCLTEGALQKCFASIFEITAFFWNIMIRYHNISKLHPVVLKHILELKIHFCWQFWSDVVFCRVLALTGGHYSRSRQRLERIWHNICSKWEVELFEFERDRWNYSVRGRRPFLLRAFPTFRSFWVIG